MPINLAARILLDDGANRRVGPFLNVAPGRRLPCESDFKIPLAPPNAANELRNPR
jgi:hypothetical protein